MNYFEFANVDYNTYNFVMFLLALCQILAVFVWWGRGIPNIYLSKERLVARLVAKFGVKKNVIFKNFRFYNL